MRYLILSDLHSNLEALQAVLEAAEGAYDEVVCCGDLVGYGPDPDAVVDWVREHALWVVRGNHDKACFDEKESEDFSEGARLSAYWTRRHVSAENVQYLLNLAKGPRDVGGQFTILHGSPSDEDEYVPTVWAAAQIFRFLPQRVSFFGHTHLQGGFVKNRDRVSALPLKPISRLADSSIQARGVLEIQPEEAYYLNPGSVGQPRDHDHRAAFAVYDTDGLVQYGRAPYDLETTVKKILDAGLPEFLAYRLMIGR